MKLSTTVSAALCTFSSGFEFEKADRENNELYAEMTNFKTSISKNADTLDRLNVFKELSRLETG